MTPVKFFSTLNRKKVAAYLIEKGNHSTTFGAIEEQTGVMYRTVRDILGKAEVEGFLIKERLQEERQGVQIELLSPMLDAMEQLREACKDVLPQSTKQVDPANLELSRITDEEFEKSWSELYKVGWNAELTAILIGRLESRGKSLGGVKPSFDHAEFVLANKPPCKLPEENLMYFFRGLDNLGYIAIPSGYVPSEVEALLKRKK